MKYIKKFNDYLNELFTINTNNINGKFLNESYEIKTKNKTGKFFDLELAQTFMEARTDVINNFPQLRRMAGSIPIIEVPLEEVEIGGKKKYIRRVQTAQTDGEIIAYNPIWIRENCKTIGGRLDINKICFVYMHELLHCTLGHCDPSETSRFASLQGGMSEELNKSLDVVIDNMIHLKSNGKYVVVDIHKDFVFYNGKTGKETGITKLDSVNMHLLLTCKLNSDLYNKYIQEYNLDEGHVLQIRNWEGAKSVTNPDPDIIDMPSGKGKKDNGSMKGDIRQKGSLRDDLGEDNKNKHGEIDKAKQDANNELVNSGLGKGSSNGGSDDGIHTEFKKINLDFNWKGKLAKFLKLKKREDFEDIFYSKRKLQSTGLMVYTSDIVEIEENKVGKILTFIDTSVSIGVEERNMFIESIIQIINKNKVTHCDIIPVSVGIHAEDKISLKVNKILKREDVLNTINAFVTSSGKKGLSSRSGTSNFNEIFNYCDEYFGEIKKNFPKSKPEDFKVIIFTDGDIYDEPIKQSTWNNVSEKAVLWVIDNSVGFNVNKMWFGEYTFISNKM